MNTLSLRTRLVTCSSLPLSYFAACSALVAEEIYRAQGEMAGEVTANSAIVQTRLTAVNRNVDGDVPGARGVARFEYGTDRQLRSSEMTPWSSSRPETDYIIKAVLKDLQPGTRYYYRVHYGPSLDQTQIGPVCTFRTLQGADGIRSLKNQVASYGSWPVRARNQPRASQDLRFWTTLAKCCTRPKGPGRRKNSFDVRR